MTESQRTYTHQQRPFRADPKGICLRSIGKVLSQLLDLTVRIEELAQSDAYVAAEVKLSLRGNQMIRTPLQTLATELDSAIYNIVVAFHLTIPDMMGNASAECSDWIPWSSRPQKHWKDLYLPRLQCYMTFKTSVLPAGEPLPVKPL
eukprot:CAMPEP_0173412252 /NCGR_PEP_ID=MMETSP1356-20130122/79041_1 /TAXON_ID=77927 ORGANISM="Hemiselmis virescens, Strain PCC157" /NCGR_SAMPLE_ID=MMETSP1356 /ASSEMBLY_ACC=CAM_ASM_000847 /LENGTH=146 /DNA_ID=CAMNT_0014374127 /DNA_START=36 /DNA_END=476 /DNA_ORIENTATION=+